MISSGAAVAVSCSVTNAFGRSPQCGCGIPMTAHSSTAGWAAIVCSTSMLERVSPSWMFLLIQPGQVGTIMACFVPSLGWRSLLSWVDDAVERHEHAGGDGCHPGSLSVLPVLNHQTIPVAGTHRLRPGGLDRSHGRQHGTVQSVPGSLERSPS